MIIVGFLMFGLSGLAAYAGVILVGALIYAPFYWGYRLVRCLVWLVGVWAWALFSLARYIVQMAWRVARLAFRFVRFLVMAFVHVGGDLVRLAR